MRVRAVISVEVKDAEWRREGGQTSEENRESSSIGQRFAQSRERVDGSSGALPRGGCGHPDAGAQTHAESGDCGGEIWWFAAVASTSP